MAITIIIIEVGEFFNPYSARPEKRPFGRIRLNNHFEKLAFGSYLAKIRFEPAQGTEPHGNVDRLCLYGFN